MTRKKKSGGEAGAEGAGAASAPPAKAPAQAVVSKSVPAKAPAASAPASGGEKPKAKAESKAKAKAATQATVPVEAAPPVAEAKPKAKGKAEAKAEPKAKESKGKAPSAPAATTSAPAASKAKAKGQAKATSEPAAKAMPDAKAKGKAKAASSAPLVEARAPPKPAPMPVPAVDVGDGEEVVVSRKKRRNRKKAEAEAEESWVQDQSQERARQAQDEADRDRVQAERAEHSMHHHERLDKFQQTLAAQKDLTKLSVEEVAKELPAQKKALEALIMEVDETLQGVKMTKPKNTNTGKIMDQMKELRLCPDDGTFAEETKGQMLQDLDQALSKSLGWEAFQKIRTDCLKLKEQAEAKIKGMEEISKTVKAGNTQKRILQRVANSKGVKAEELSVDKIVSLNVDLPPEVISLSFLYQRKFEKQFGVVIDRPDGSKGGGKGGPQPKSLVLRGVEAEAAECMKALKAIDLSDKKVISGATSKQLAGLKAKWPKIEEDFPRVYLHTDRNQVVTLHGPTKEVKECHERLVKEMPEPAAEPTGPTVTSSPVISIDKDRARALIGANGSNVKKIEADTGTSIKVNSLQRKDDEDSPASVKITGDKAAQDKAREKILAFINNLGQALVEADPEVVSRMYDGAIQRSGKGGKGKGRGGGGGSGEKPSKFADLRDQSGLTVVRKPSGILLVGDKESVNKWKVVLQECVKDANCVPASVKLAIEQAKFWTSERLEAVSTDSGAKVSLVRRNRESVLEIAGTDAHKDAAKTQIQELHEKMSFVETIEGVSAGAVRSLTAKGAGRMKEVEQKHEVSILCDRKSQAVKITGEKAAVEAAKKAVEVVIASAANTTEKTIEIEWDEGRIVIGKGGVTVKHIKAQSGLEDLQVEDQEGASKKKVSLRGSEDAVDEAIKMVREVLAKARREKEQGVAVEGGDEKPAKPAADKHAEASAAPEAGTQAAAAPAAAPAPVEKRSSGAKSKPGRPKPNLESKELFPTLGGGSADAKQGKSKPNNTAWKRVEDNAAAGQVPEKESEDDKEEEEEEPEEAEAEDSQKAD